MNDDILNLRFSNGMHIWPLIRYEILKQKYFAENQVAKMSTALSLGQVIGRLIRGIFYFRIKRKDIIFITSTLFNFRKSEQTPYFNILDDYYYNVAPENSVIYEYPADFNWRYPKSNKETFTTLFYLELFSSLCGKIIFKFKRRNTDVSVLREYFKEYPIDNIYAIDSFVYVYSWLLDKFFAFTKAKFLVINCGCYGGTQAMIINVAKRRGIKVAEIQHGVLGIIPYGIEPEMEYNDYCPDYLFTFGDFWNDKIKLPVQALSMGHPHLNATLREKGFRERELSLLILSQPGITKQLLDICLDIRKKNKMKIIFRPHPIEVISDEFISLCHSNEIIISDKKKDLYSEFRRVTAVCGMYSFSLYEAFAFNLKVYAVDTVLSRNYISECIAFFVKTADDILNSIEDKVKLSDREFVWKSHFQDNYKQFLKQQRISNGIG